MDKMIRTIRTSTILKSGNNILHNRFILYFILMISILNIIGFTTSGNFISPVIFVLVGFLTTFFSKNMLVVLMVPLLITNILNYGNTNMEGMDNEEDTKEKEPPSDEDMTEMKEKYSELFELQNTILDGMDKVTQSLDKAEPILNKLKEKFQS